jgi:hypothetical protein
MRDGYGSPGDIDIEWREQIVVTAKEAPTDGVANPRIKNGI